MSTRPCSRASASETRTRSSLDGPTLTISAPSARTPGDLDRRRVRGHHDHGPDAQDPGGPRHALGVVAATSGRPRRVPAPRRSGCASALYAPRSLKAPMGWSISGFSHTRGWPCGWPSMGRPNGSSGVRTVMPARSAAAAPDVVDARPVGRDGRSAGLWRDAAVTPVYSPERGVRARPVTRHRRAAPDRGRGDRPCR